MTDTATVLDILARPGGNDQVINKKVLLAALTSAEAARLGITPDADFVAMIQANFLASNGIHDRAALTQWLRDAELSDADFTQVMQDFAAVVAVETQLVNRLAPCIELHRRVMTAHSRRISTSD